VLKGSGADAARLLKVLVGQATKPCGHTGLVWREEGALREAAPGSSRASSSTAATR